MENVNNDESLDLEKIKEVLPYRGRWLLLKEVLSVDKNMIRARTWFSKNLCEGHFEKRLIVPGALISEAMKQTAAFMVMSSDSVEKNVLPAIKRETFNYKGIVLPEETIEIEVKLLTEKNGFYFFEGEAKKEKNTVLEGKFIGVKINKKEGF